MRTIPATAAAGLLIGIAIALFSGTPDVGAWTFAIVIGLLVASIGAVILRWLSGRGGGPT